DGRVLNARAGQVRHGDLIAAGAARLAPGNDLTKLGKGGSLSYQAGSDGVMQFAEPACLLQAVGDIEARAGDSICDDSRFDLVLVLGIRAHGGDMLAGLQP